MSLNKSILVQLFPEDDQSILIETSSWNQQFFSELIRDSHYMVLPQTFPYWLKTLNLWLMWKTYIFWFFLKEKLKKFLCY